MAPQSHAKSRSFQLPLLFLIEGQPSVCACPIHGLSPLADRTTPYLGSPLERQGYVGPSVQEKHDRLGSPGLVGWVSPETLLFVRGFHCNGRRLGAPRRRTDGCGPVWRLRVL